MRIPFDIKYRKEIESGEYNVVWGITTDYLTSVTFPARIVCWDFGNDAPILALCQKPGCTEEFSRPFYLDGKCQGLYDEVLYIEIPETPEMEFENYLAKLLDETPRFARLKKEDPIEAARELMYHKSELLRLAKNVLVPKGYAITWKPEKK